MQYGKEKKRHRDLRGRNKMLFDNKVSMYIECSKELQRKELEVSEFSKIVWYKINKPSLTAFLYTSE